MTKKISHDRLKLVYPIIIMIVISLGSCQKSLKETPSTAADQQLTEHKHKKGLNENADVAIKWYKLQLRIILNANPAIPNGVVIRTFAYTGITLYESVQSGIPHAVSLSKRLYQMPAMPSIEKNKGYSWSLSANAALASITRKMFTSLTDQNKASIDSLENALNEALTHHGGSAVLNRSQAFGRAIAQAVFDWSKSDKFDLANAPYTPPVFPGAWEPTPPAFANAATPYLANARPFLQIHTQGVAPVVPFAYSENPSSDFYKMVRDVYDVSKSLTTEQRNIALYWNDLGIGRGYTPPGHSISILNQVLENEGAKLGTAAQAYAKAGMGLWDGVIMCWRSKFTYNLVRPVTYIRKVIDPTWLSLIGTPPHPEYPAAHAYITSSTMLAIAAVLGNKHVFTDHTYDFIGFPSRNFTTLSAVGVESGISRLYGGIHYMNSIIVGTELGQTVGREIGRIKLFDDDEDDDDDDNDNEQKN